MTLAELRLKSDEELIQLSLQRNTRGKFTPLAEQAMKVRRKRAGKWDVHTGKPRSFQKDLIAERGTSGFVKRFK